MPQLDRGLIRSSPKDGLSTPYRFREKCWTAPTPAFSPFFTEFVGIQPIYRPIINMVLENIATFLLNLFRNYGTFSDISLNPLALS